MFIVVESGSTKADWMVVDGASESVHYTKGFNPYFHSKEDILHELMEHEALVALKDKVSELFFYGAGCSSPELNRIVHDGLSAFFAEAKIEVNHDLDACAYACYTGVPEIACILGTGSNSCYYDGNEVSEVVPALGHILGDEASGSFFGKKVLADFLYGRLPRAMHEEFENKGLNKAIIIENVYRKPDANVYIASHMPVLMKHKKLPYSQELFRDGIQQFIDTHVKCYPNYSECEVNFVGSLAYLLSDELHATFQENGLSVKRIIRRPLESLTEYHKSRLARA